MINVEQASQIYQTLGGKFKKKAGKALGSNIFVHSNVSLWKFVKSQCATPDRTCLVCGFTAQANYIGEIIRCHGNVMMAADRDAAMIKEMPDATVEPAEVDSLDLEHDRPKRKKPRLEREKPEKPERRERPEPKPTPKMAPKMPGLAPAPKGPAEILAKLIKDETNAYDSYWVVKQDDNLIFKATLAQAYKDRAGEFKDTFFDERYGRRLVAAIKQHGLDVVADGTFGGRGTVFTTAQVNSNAPDFLVREEGIEDNRADADTGQRPQGNQANPAMVKRDRGDELLADVEDKTEVLELLSDALIPIIVASEDKLTVDDVVREIQQLGSNESVLNEWKGKLEEKVQSATEDNEEEATGLQVDQANVQGPTPPPTEQPMATAPVVSASLRERMLKLNVETDDLRNRLRQTESANKTLTADYRKANLKTRQLFEDNKLLLRERQYRLIAPRVRRLAQKMVDVGMTPADMIDSASSDLLQMTDANFHRKEVEVEKVYGRFQSVRAITSAPKIVTEGLHAVLSTQVTEDPQGRDMRGKRSGPSNSTYEWSKPDTNEGD